MNTLKSHVSLKVLQEGLKQIFTGRSLPSEFEAEVKRLIVEAPPLSRARRISIYQDAWFIRLSESLEEDFPGVKKILGRKRFFELALEYFQAFPSKTYTLVHASDRFPKFLKRHKISKSKPWIVDQAEFEKADYVVFHKANCKPWNLKQLQTLSPKQAEKLKVRISRSVQLLDFNWDVSGWSPSRTGKPRRQANIVIVYRPRFTPIFQKINIRQRQFLKKLSLPCSLTDLHDWDQS